MLKSSQSSFKQISTTILTPLTTTIPTTIIQARYPTYKPQPDILPPPSPPTSTTPSYDPFQFQIKEIDNIAGGDKSKINPAKKLAFLKDVEKLRDAITSSSEHHSLNELSTLNRNRRTTGRPLIGVTVTPRSFTRSTEFERNDSENRRFRIANTKRKTAKFQSKKPISVSSRHKHKQELTRVPKSATMSTQNRRS